MIAKCKIALISADESKVPNWVFEELSKHDITLAARKCENLQEVKDLAAGADIIWLSGANQFLKAEVLPLLHRCGAIIRTGSGTDDIPVAAASQLGIIVANTPEAIAESVAEHTVALLFSVIRHIAVQDKAVRAGDWGSKHSYPNHHLRGSSLGLISFGRIARHVAEMLSGFHLKISAFDPLVSPDVIAASGVEPASFDQILENSDFISIHCPLNDKTRGLIGAGELKRMKSTAILINTSRGEVVDQAALTEALQQGAIAAGGLDVLQTEPPEKDDPLLQIDNVIHTPHMAAFNDQFEYNFWQCSVTALLEMAYHRWPPSVVNPAVKPKWDMA